MWIDCEGRNKTDLFSSVQLSCVRLFSTLQTAACQASLSITNSQSSPKPMSIELVMPTNHLILCHPFLLLPSIFPSIRVFSSESALHIRWPKYWSFSFNLSPSNECSGLISFRMDWLTFLDRWNYNLCRKSKVIEKKNRISDFSKVTACRLINYWHYWLRYFCRNQCLWPVICYVSEYWNISDK